MGESTEADRKAIDQFIEDLTEAFIDRDLERFITFYDDNVVCLPPDIQPIEGIRAWRDWLSGWWDQLTVIETNDTRRVDVVSGDKAIEWHIEETIGRFGDGP